MSSPALARWAWRRSVEVRPICIQYASFLILSHRLCYIIWYIVGASHTTFVDFSAECCTTALRNAESLGFSGQANAVTTSALDVLRRPAQYNLQRTYDLVSLTPPYEEIDYSELLQAVWESPLVAADTVVAFEYPAELPKLSYVLGEDKLFGLRSRRYGRTILAIYVYRPTTHLDMRPDEFA